MCIVGLDIIKIYPEDATKLRADDTIMTRRSLAQQRVDHDIETAITSQCNGNQTHNIYAEFMGRRHCARVTYDHARCSGPLQFPQTFRSQLFWTLAEQSHTKEAEQTRDETSNLIKARSWARSNACAVRHRSCLYIVCIYVAAWDNFLPGQHYIHYCGTVCDNSFGENTSLMLNFEDVEERDGEWPSYSMGNVVENVVQASDCHGMSGHHPA